MALKRSTVRLRYAPVFAGSLRSGKAAASLPSRGDSREKCLPRAIEAASRNEDRALAQETEAELNADRR